MFGKNQTRWYIYTWVLFSTHVWILTHMYGKRHTCVKKATQLYVCKCLPFSTHVWEKPLTCLFPPELWVPWYITLIYVEGTELSMRNLEISIRMQSKCKIITWTVTNTLNNQRLAYVVNACCLELSSTVGQTTSASWQLLDAPLL